MVGGGAYSAYVNAPADLISTGSAAAASAVKGDVIQYTYNPNRAAYLWRFGQARGGASRDELFVKTRNTGSGAQADSRG
jgi:protein tyrosine phosphatase (PTP) superfamily phosphohydrolase (DUF442 family)